MDFAPNPGELWIAYPDAGGSIAVGRIIGWDTSGSRPVPVVAFVEDDGQLISIGQPETEIVWIADSRSEVIEAVKRRDRR
jgi:hypothetical protein